MGNLACWHCAKSECNRACISLLFSGYLHALLVSEAGGASAGPRTQATKHRAHTIFGPGKDVDIVWVASDVIVQASATAEFTEGR